MKIKRYTRELETLNSELKSINENSYVYTKEEVIDITNKFRELTTICLDTMQADKRAIQYVLLDSEPTLDSMKKAINNIYTHFGIDAKI